jgi:plastocyanin
MRHVLALILLSMASILAAEAIGQEAPAATRSDARICAEAADAYAKMSAEQPALAKAGDEVVVLMFKDHFCPRLVQVKAGGTVRWINVERRSWHSVWFKAEGKRESAPMFPGDELTLRFEEPLGERPYICGPHPQHMRGVVEVVAR